MQVIIMAAGKGTRLGDMTKDVPKPLIEVGGVTLLKRNIDALLKISEVSQIIVVIGYLSDQIVDYVEDKFQNQVDMGKIKLVHNEDFEKGAIVSLAKAEPYVNGSFLIVNADHIFSSVAYKEVIRAAEEITVYSFNNRKPHDDERKIFVYEDGAVSLPKNTADYKCGYTGLVFVSDEHKEEYFNSLREVIADGDDYLHPDDLILVLSRSGVNIKIHDLSKFTFLEVDNLDDYKVAQEKIGEIETEEIQGILLENYSLGNIMQIESPLMGGYLNKNFVINTQNGNYFLQQINLQSKRNLALEISVLNFLKSKGVPCINLLKNKKGSYVFGDISYDYLLSTYIEGNSPEKFNDLTAVQIVEAARTLAKLHKVFVGYSVPFDISNSNTASRKEAIEICWEVKNIIEKKKHLDEFDVHVNEIINKKISLLNTLKIPEKLTDCPQQFCHGDYHGANLIFGNDNQVVGIVDWEFSGYDDRIWEVARSMTFICSVNYVGSMLEPIDFEKAKLYLKAYHEENPLIAAELEVMVDLIKYKSLCCCFILEKHYLENNKKCDIFLPKNTNDWFWWLENGDDFAKRVINELIT